MSLPGVTRQSVMRPQRLLTVLMIVLAWPALPNDPFYPGGRPIRKHFLLAQESDHIAPYVPSPPEVVERMLKLAELKPGDVLYDLGAGDGRIVIMAAKKYGVKAVGFEINPVLVEEARLNIRAAGVEHLAEVHEQDVRYVDLAPASVVTLYLYPGANLRLRSALLRQLKPGSRVISHNFGMGTWEPDKVERLVDSAGLSRTIYLWRIRQKP